MENAPKRELADYIIYTHEGLNEDLGKLIFYKILEGIQVIHDEEICHKDIKLENILLSQKIIYQTNIFKLKYLTKKYILILYFR